MTERRWRRGLLLLCGCLVFAWWVSRAKDPRGAPRLPDPPPRGQAQACSVSGPCVDSLRSEGGRDPLVSQVLPGALATGSPEARARAEEVFVEPEVPSLQAYQEAVRRQPHGTPPLLRQFVHGTGPAIERALEPEASPAFRRQVLEFLLACATRAREAAPVSLRAYCWSAAGNLIQALKPVNGDSSELRALRDGAAPRVGSDALALAAALEAKR